MGGGGVRGSLNFYVAKEERVAKSLSWALGGGPFL